MREEGSGVLGPPPPPPPPPPPAAGPVGGPRGPTVRSRPLPRREVPASRPEPTEEVRQLSHQLRPRFGMSQEGGNEAVFLSHYHQVHPVLQDGPMCGLVALCMASQLVGRDLVTIESALSAAQTQNFSCQGEMFSARNMATLAGLLCGCTYRLSHDHRENYSNVVSSLLGESPVLVPYDADGNNEPCLKRGTKAHWAVLTGILCVTNAIDPNHLALSYEKDPDVVNLYHAKPGLPVAPCVSDVIKKKDFSSVFVFAKHGKSGRTALWPLCKLLASNANLVEVGSKIQADRDNFIVPKEGIEKTLCDQLVILNRLRN